ncbi:MAG: DUF378 domain-containing protein [Oscillospiraceae bacterium]
MLDRIALVLLVIGGLNWGLVGLFQFDLVAWAFGGAAGIISRIIYVLVALSALWCISLFFRKNEVIESSAS